ncbi:MAG: serine/threonine protein kinase [Cellulomonas sp.]|nr:serine/threonine protein kinase [Cellulomonas sp.]
MERIGLAPGTPIGGYTIVAPLGQGGMGAVYRAVDDGGGAVALKLLHPDVGADPVARARLTREAAALQRLRHPAVARVLDVEADSTEAFLVTELVPGRSLDVQVRTDGPLGPQALVDLAVGLHAALAAVHEAGVLHRDLKPSNVMMTTNGPVLIDFGLAQSAGDTQLTSTGLLVGTPGYLAPELLDGQEPGPTGDLWGWAAVLAYAATGHPPFGSGPVGTVLARSRAGEPDLSGLPPRTEAALRAALRPDPVARLQPAELIDALRATAQGEPDPADEMTHVVVDRDAATTTLAGAAGAAGAAANDGRTRVFVPPPPGAEPTEVVGPPAPPVPTVGAPELLDDRPDLIPGSAGPDEPGLPPVPSGSPSLDLDGPPGYQRPPATRRWGSVLALGVLVAAAGTQYPTITLAVALVGLVLMRAVGSGVEAFHGRRERLGVRGSDRVLAVVGAPWHLLLALLGLLPGVVIGSAVVVIALGFTWWLVGSGQWALTDAPAGAVPTGVGVAVVMGAVVLLGVLLIWFGPLGRLTRIGARRTLAVIAPGPLGALVVVVVALAASAVLVARMLAGEPIVWWPLEAPHLPLP